MEVTKPVCGYCGKEIKGRSDKKYCDDSCRNAFNHRQKEAENRLPNIQPIIAILKRNRAVLATAKKDKKTKMLIIPKERLLELGYNFLYCTEHIRYEEYDHYFCFDLGYVIKRSGQCELLQRDAFQFEMEINDPDFFKPQMKLIEP
jgi:hypothetical protein